MRELDKTIKKSILFFLLMINISYGNEHKLESIINYIDKTFEFDKSDDRKLFIHNQSAWLKLAKNDCKIIYADIGSHASFMIHYNSCLAKIKDERFLFLFRNYVCKYSLMNGNKCIIPSQLESMMSD